MPNRPLRHAAPRLHRQRGQALVYGIFMLTLGLAALFFMFNTGQLTEEKSKLVNTADAVAYSAGVMHARALNFDAYTNRALMANEVLIAQTISIASWADYAADHANNVPPMNCYEVVYSIPLWLGLAEYLPLCVLISYPQGAMLASTLKTMVSAVAPSVIVASEVAKAGLQLSQGVMFAALLPARAKLMNEVADANYEGDGEVKVDLIPLTDNFTLFEGGFFITRYSGDERTRFAEAEQSAAYMDGFVKQRNWDSESPLPCKFPNILPRGHATRRGETHLENFDDWKASDRASLKVEHYEIKPFSSGCKTDAEYTLGEADRSASQLGYKGVPSYYELSKKALAYDPSNSDAAKRDPRLKFAIRLTRAAGETKTSAGRSAIKPTGSMNIYQSAAPNQMMAAVATSEVYFERPPQAGGWNQGAKGIELASLFNPYWQVHLIGSSTGDVNTARLLQMGSLP